MWNIWEYVKIWILGDMMGLSWKYMVYGCLW
jgi:hypothetical protein